MIEGLTLYNFFLEMVISLILFVCGLNRRKRFWLRLFLSLAVIGVCWYIFLFVIPETWTLWNICKYVILFGMFVIGVRMCFDIGFSQSCFCCTAGFALQHCVCKLNVFIRILFAMNGHDVIWVYYIVTPIIYAVIFILYGKKARSSLALNMRTIPQILLGIAMMFIATIVSSVFDIGFCGNNVIVFLAFVGLDAFMSLMVLLMQFVLYENEEFQKDIIDMEKMHEIELKQAERTAELIEAINIKSHDLKHKLIGMNDKLDKQETDDILSTISLYDNVPHTENPLLDAVLAQKLLLMERRGITFSPMIDASKLNMLSKGDLFSLFGNILDNAIEAVSELSDDDNKNIVLVMKNIPGFVSVHCENEFIEGKIAFDGDLPKTLKSDKLSHGFGLKSIKFICKKYGGTMAIEVSKNLFKIDILLPY